LKSSIPNDIILVKIIFFFILSHGIFVGAPEGNVVHFFEAVKSIFSVPRSKYLLVDIVFLLFFWAWNLPGPEGFIPKMKFGSFSKLALIPA